MQAHVSDLDPVSQVNLQRQKVKDMLQAWEHEQPGRVNNIFRAISNVEPSHLADVNLYDFKSLTQAKTDDEDPMFDHIQLGDIASKHSESLIPNSGTALSISSNDGTRIEFARNNFKR